MREGACRCSHSNTFFAKAYRTHSILKLVGVIFVTFFGFLCLWALLGCSWVLLGLFGGFLGTPGVIWVLLLFWDILGASLGLLGDLGAFLGLVGALGACPEAFRWSWDAEAPFSGFGQGVLGVAISYCTLFSKVN
mgnify:CR=1 FL=1